MPCSSAAQVPGSWSSAASTEKLDPSRADLKVLWIGTGAPRLSSPRAERRSAPITSGSFIVDAA